jgi:hypothetical protein
MQLMIDTTTESAEGLRRIAAILAFAAAQLDGAGPVSAAVIAAPSVPTGTAAAPALPAVIAPSPPVEVMKADAGHSSELPDPAKIFGQAPAVPEVPAAPNPSAPVAPLPIAGNAATPAVPPAVELDGAGFPHDARIHSGTPTKNANGLWRMRRGVDNPTIEAVEAELRAIYPAPVKVTNVGQTTLTLAPGGGAPDVPVPPGASATVSLPVVPTPPGVATPGSAVQAPIAPGVPSGNDAFRVMMDRFSKEMGANGRLNKTVMAPIFAALGVAGWQEFFKKPELIPNITAEAERLLA